MNKTEPKIWREKRRFRALDLYSKGWTQSKIAEALGVSQSSISLWLKKVKIEGEESLLIKKSSGKPAKLSVEQLNMLPELLSKGALYYGFYGDLWTRQRIADVIYKYFNVRYDPSHISRILKKCGWSLQKPIRRAIQRNEKEISNWINNKWSMIKKKPK